jgi:hypothetical protein
MDENNSKTIPLHLQNQRAQNIKSPKNERAQNIKTQTTNQTLKLSFG